MSPPKVERGCYLYGVARGVTADDLRAVDGLRGASVRAVEHRGLTAIVSEVDLDEFGEDGLRHHLEDLAWLEEVARSHDAVVRAVAPIAPTAPVRLATICLDDDAVRARLEESHDALRRTLDRLDGRMEWSVKAFLDSSATSDPDPASASDGTTPSGNGAGVAYLRQRRAEATSRERATARAAALADSIHAALSQYSAASRRLAPQDRRLTGDDATMTLNGAYLVDTSATERFLAAARSLIDEHPTSRMRVDGPWPPYSFSTLDEP